MQHKSDYRYGHGQAELRLVAIATTRSPSVFADDKAICLNCKEVFSYDGKNYPEKCPMCGEHEYCLPDLYGYGPCNSVIFVNGPHHDKVKFGKNKPLKDKQLYAMLAAMVRVFVIMPQEIDAMTDSSLVLWLEGTLHSKPEIVYKGEKEYSCLR